MQHSKNAVLYALSNGFERASFYGIRAILVLFMVGETMNMTTIEALGVYGIFTMSVYGSKVVGALIGDILIGNKKTLLIGGLLQSIACFMFCIQSITMFYASIVLFVIGNGLFSSNIIAQFGKQYVSKPKVIDSGFTGYFVFINIGTFLGVLLLSRTAELNYSYSFALGGFIMLVATLISYFARDNKLELSKEANKPKETNIGYRTIFIFVAIILSGFFWIIYELSYFGVYEIKIAIIENSNLVISKELIMNLLNSYFGIFIAFVLTIVWTFIHTNQFFKFFIGLVISTLAFTLLSLIPEANLSILLLFMFLLALGEMLISPMLYAITTKHTNMKYLAIALSFVTIPLMVFNKVSSKLAQYASDLGLKEILIGSTIVLFLSSLLALTFWLIEKHISKNSMTKV